MNPMRKRARVSRAGVLLVLACWMTGPLSALGADIKIGVIDRQQVLERTAAGKRAMERLKEFSATRQRIISADDEELKRLEEELKSQNGGTDEARRRDRQELFRTKFESYQRRLQEFNREIQSKQLELADEFQKKIQQITSAVAEKGGYTLVMDKGNDNGLRIVIYASPKIDMTERVIKEFDRQHK